MSKKIEDLIESMNLRHYQTYGVIRMLQNIVDRPKVGTVECDNIVGFGTYPLTLKLLKRFEAMGWLTKEKSPLNQYQWSATDALIQLLPSTTTQ